MRANENDLSWLDDFPLLKEVLQEEKPHARAFYENALRKFPRRPKEAFEWLWYHHAELKVMNFWGWDELCWVMNVPE